MGRNQRMTGSTRRQRGAVAVFVGIALLALVTAALLLFDIGNLYYAQRDLQRLATLAALAGSQTASGCGNSGVPASTAAVLTQVQNIIASNNTRGTVITPGISTDSNEVELGRTQTNSAGLRVFTTLADGDPNINAVRVNLTAPMPYSFLSHASGGNLYASATAQQANTGVFTIGSTLLNLNTQQSPLLNPLLSGLLGTSVNLTAAGYQQLVSAPVTLAGLMVAAGVTNLNDLASLKTSLPGALQILGTALSNGGAGVSGAAGGLISGLAKQSYTNLGANQAFFGQIFNTVGGSLNPTVNDALSAIPFANGYGLLTALGQAAAASNPSNAISLPLNGLLDVPGVATVSAFLKVGQPPQYGFYPGQPTASTAQATVNVRIAAGGALTALTNAVTATLNGLLGTLGALLGLPTPVITFPNPLNIGIDIVAAPASATMLSLQCPQNGVNGGSPIATMTAQTGVATVKVGTFNSAATAPQPLSTASPWTVLDANLDASHVCVGLSILGLCLTYANLGKTDIQVNLNPTAAGVSAWTTPNPPGLVFAQFTRQANTSPPVYLANNPASDGSNPQTIPPGGLATSVQLGLGLAVTHNGSGLIDGLANLVSSLLTAVTGALQSVLNLVNGLAVSLIDPLLNLLGVQLGTATVTMQSASIARPSLVSTCLPGMAVAPAGRGCPSLP